MNLTEFMLKYSVLLPNNYFNFLEQRQEEKKRFYLKALKLK